MVVNHLRRTEMAFCGKGSGDHSGAPGHFLSGLVLFCFHFHPLPTSFRSKTLHLSVSATLLAGQNSPHKEENESGERCVGEGTEGKELVFEE